MDSSVITHRWATNRQQEEPRAEQPVGGEPELGRLGYGFVFRCSRVVCIVNIRAIASYVTRHHSPRPNRCQSIFVLHCMRRWPGHRSRLSAHKPDNGVHPETMPGVMQSRCDEERPCLVMRPFSVCVCVHVTIITVSQSQGESQVKQTTMGTDLNETISSASIYSIHIQHLGMT